MTAAVQKEEVSHRIGGAEDQQHGKVDHVRLIFNRSRQAHSGLSIYIICKKAQRHCVLSEIPCPMLKHLYSCCAKLLLIRDTCVSPCQPMVIAWAKKRWGSVASLHGRMKFQSSVPLIVFAAEDLGASSSTKGCHNSQISNVLVYRPPRASRTFEPYLVRNAWVTAYRQG